MDPNAQELERNGDEESAHADPHERSPRTPAGASQKTKLPPGRPPPEYYATAYTALLRAPLPCPSAPPVAPPSGILRAAFRPPWHLTTSMLGTAALDSGY